MPAAFQSSAFQNNAFQTSIVVSTLVLPFPVNCVLMGEQLYERTGRTYQKMPGKAGRRTIASSAGGGRLGGDAPSFTVTRSRGYD
jgi:hypothetical protein